MNWWGSAAAAILVATGLAISLCAYFCVRTALPPAAFAVSPAVSANHAQVSATKAASATSAVTQGSFTFANYPKYPPMGQRFGSITLPRLKLSWPIYQGAGQSQLAKGVAHYSKSVLPGQDDNTVLSGHRNTVFNRLGELQKGDLIYIKTSAGVFTYKMRTTRIVLKTDKTVIVHTDHAVLTLTTCYPFNNIGATSHAYVVIADLQP